MVAIGALPLLPVRTRGGRGLTFALVDVADLPRLLGRRWTVRGPGYVGQRTTGGVIYLHREVMGARKGEEVDHRNGNRFDNRSANLRICTRQQNAHNVPARGGKSPYRGVFQTKGSPSWFAQVKCNGRQHYLGSYKTQEEAAAVAEAFRREHMPFAVPDR